MREKQRDMKKNKSKIFNYTQFLKNASFTQNFNLSFSLSKGLVYKKLMKKKANVG